MPVILSTDRTCCQGILTSGLMAPYNPATDGYKHGIIGPQTAAAYNESLTGKAELANPLPASAIIESLGGKPPTPFTRALHHLPRLEQRMRQRFEILQMQLVSLWESAKSETRTELKIALNAQMLETVRLIEILDNKLHRYRKKQTNIKIATRKRNRKENPFRPA